MKARARIVNDPECERQLLRFLAQHPRTDVEALRKAFPWGKAALSKLLTRLIGEWRIAWRMEYRAGCDRPRPWRVYWLAPPDLAQHADPTIAARRVSRSIKPNAGETSFYFHTGTPPDRAGAIQVLAIAGRRE